MPETLPLDEIKRRIAEAQGLSAVAEDPSDIWSQYQYIRPLSDAAQGYIDTVGNPEGRFLTGLPSVDFVTRGWGAGHLVIVFGSSHSGKSQFMLNAMANNKTSRMLWVTPDEPAELVLSKMACVELGIDAETVEAAIKAGDKEMEEALMAVATEAFPNTIIIDQALNKEELWTAIEEAQDLWGAPIELVVYDYLEQFPVGDTDFGGVSQKALAFKMLSKVLPCPLVVIHQSSRSAGDRGKPLGMRAMRFGGENEATFALEVFRRMEDPELSAFERQKAERQLQVNICKNKVPPCRRKIVDLFMDPMTGKIRDWHDDDGRINQLDEARRKATLSQGPRSALFVPVQESMT